MRVVSLNQSIGGSTNAILADMLYGITFVGIEEPGWPLSLLVFNGSNGLVMTLHVHLLSMSGGQPAGGVVHGFSIAWNGQQILEGSFDGDVEVSEIYPALIAAGAGDYSAIDTFFANLRFGMTAAQASGGISFIAGNGDDGLFGSQFDDYLEGGAGDDVFMGYEGSDWIVGGSGYDTIDYGAGSGHGGLLIDMRNGTVTNPQGEVDQIAGIEYIIGSVYSDRFIGDDHANVYRTNHGGDQVHMGKGIDTLFISDLSRSNFVIDLAAGTLTDAVFSIGTTTFSGIEYISFNDGFLELEDHTIFGGTMSADLLAADLTTGALRFWDADLAAPVHVAALGNRHVIGMGNFAGDLTDDVVYRTDSGWYGLIDSSGTNVNVGYRAGQSLLAIGDFSGDGRDDLLFENDSTGYLSLVSGGNLANVNIGARAGQTLVAVGDFNGDAKEDLLFRSDSSGWLSYARGGDFTNVNVGFRAGQEILAVGDFDGNGRDDILFRSISTGWLSYARGGNDANINVGYKAGHDVLGAGDFNDDGATDILARNSNSGWLSYTDGKTGENVNVGFANGRTLVGIGDYDGDGASDLLFQSNSTKVVSFMSAANASQSVVLGNFTGQEILSGDFGTNMGDDMLIA